MPESNIKVIIAGAGIAGLASAIALRHHPRIDVELFDQATKLKEIGASIALSPNGLRTLEKLGVENALDDEVAFRGPSAIPMIYRHWKTNEIISHDSFVNVPHRLHQTARFHRAHLHQALLENVPRELVHTKKKVLSAEVDEDGVTVHFADGTNVRGDVLIGADGIRSKVRTTFAPDHKLKWTGKIALRTTFDASLVEGIPDLPLDSTHWWGLNTTFFASRLGKSQFTVVGNWDPKQIPGKNPDTINWDDEGDVKLLRDIYKDWNPVVKALTEAAPDTRLFPNFAGEPLPIWTFGHRVTLVGDAAHTHGGANAAGGSLAIDDSYALLLAFSHVISSSDSTKPSRSEIERALKLYENVRRPHTDRLQKGVLSAVNAAKITTEEALIHKVQSRPSTTWLSEHDVEAAFANAVERESSLSEREQAHGEDETFTSRL